MNSLPKDRILQYNEDTLDVVRKTFDLDKPDVMKNVVNILEEWVKQQNHFIKKDFDRRYLETTIIVSKGSIEKAKLRLDRGCTLRTLMPHLFDIQDLRHIYKTDLKDIRHVILPKMTKNHERVYMLKNVGKKFTDTALPNYAKCLPALTEYIRRNDYAVNNYIVLDYVDVNLMELAKGLTVSCMQEIVALMLDCCGFRIKAIYVISTSKMVDMIVAIFKQVLSAKLGERIQVLKDRKCLQDVIDKDILPKDYGGNEKTLDALHDDWMDVLTSEDHLKYMKEINTAGTDESKRQNGKFNEEYLGMPGSFRQLNVD